MFYRAILHVCPCLFLLLKLNEVSHFRSFIQTIYSPIFSMSFNQHFSQRSMWVCWICSSIITSFLRKMHADVGNGSSVLMQVSQIDACLHMCYEKVISYRSCGRVIKEKIHPNFFFFFTLFYSSDLGQLNQHL